MDRLDADVLIAGDFRFPGGTSTAIAAEVRALADAGYRIVLQAWAVPFLSHWRGFHPEIAGLIASGKVVLAAPGQPVKARLACLHHPAVFQALPAHPVHIDCDHALMIVHHPPVDAAGAPQYDLSAIQGVLAALLPVPVDWAPVGPKVRAALRTLDEPPPLTAGDWVGIVDTERAAGPRGGPMGARPVIGRHSRPEPEKWPDDRESFLQAYPDHPDFDVHLLGVGAALRDKLAPLPGNWRIAEFGGRPVDGFLSGIDYFVYFHGSTWVEAFGRAIVEAMAAGVVCILPPHFRPLFAEGAIYCEAEDVADTVRALHADSAAYARQSEQGFAVVRERFSPAVAVGRVAQRIGPPKAKAPAPATGTAHRRPRVLYFTSNGVGMGHLTRVLAAARRQRERVEPVVVSMSQAFDVARDEGIMAEHIPFFRSVGMDQDHWHDHLALELAEVFRFYRPTVAVLDGNVPYRGLTEAFATRPEMRRIWLRRAMWRPEVGQVFLNEESRFDTVIEPGELAAVLDRGLTRRHTGRTARVAPIRFLRDDEALGRRAARAVLGLDPDRPAVLLQLGGGLNIETAALRDRIVEALASQAEAEAPQIVLAEWRIADARGTVPDGVTVLRTFPFAKYLAAFDCAVAMAGYNTFHENIAAALPTLFLSNEHPEQDEQWLRADYARITGLGLAARTGNTPDLLRGLREIARVDVQARLRRAMARLEHPNGADAVADYLADLAHMNGVHPALPDSPRR